MPKKQPRGRLDRIRKQQKFAASGPAGDPRGPTMRFWISWVQPGDDYRPISFPPPPEVLGWWCSGETEDAHTLCALVAAGSEAEAKAIIRQPSLWADAGEWRFCDPKPADWLPGDRFPLPDWSPLRRTDNG